MQSKGARLVRLSNIVVEDGDYKGRRELVLKHHHDGKDLDTQYAEKTLQHVWRIWQHPVHRETKLAEKDQVERVVH